MTAPEIAEIREFINAAWDGNVAHLGAFVDKYPDCVEITRGEPIGWNGLMWAAQSGNTDSIEFFLSRGANIERRDLHRQTPLMMAAHRGHLPAVKLLLEKGADAMATDNADRNAADCARAADKDAVVAILEQAIAARLKIQADAERAAAEALLNAEKALQDRMRQIARSGRFRLQGRKP